MSKHNRQPLAPQAPLNKEPETKEELIEAIQVFNDSLNHHSEQLAFHQEQMDKYREGFDKLKIQRETLFKRLREKMGEKL